MLMTENIPENTSHTSRNRNIRFIAQCSPVCVLLPFILWYIDGTGRKRRESGYETVDSTDAAVLCRTAD